MILLQISICISSRCIVIRRRRCCWCCSWRRSTARNQTSSIRLTCTCNRLLTSTCNWISCSKASFGFIIWIVAISCICCSAISCFFREISLVVSSLMRFLHFIAHIRRLCIGVCWISWIVVSILCAGA